ncbi:hypothetical protein [Staphylococcus hyicus]|uniref:hypothetical protein n=1 Tax=Staphylococcus hyicus TaxID=1284 RepID=UPI0027385F1A|nr:hypothetical protein [Staphylococcus hyicus]MDP4468702.1 hypothetical protein [Staphylococcus hyicus]
MKNIKEYDWIFRGFGFIVGLEVKKTIGSSSYQAMVTGYVFSKTKQDLTLNYCLKKWNKDRMEYTETHSILLTPNYICNFLIKQNKGYQISKDFLKDDLILLVRKLLNKRLSYLK